MRKPSRRGTVLGTAVAGVTVALGIGGVAYATAGDPATPDQGYVVVEDGPGGTGTDGHDCPDKGHGGQSQSPPQSSQADPQGQA